MESVHRGQGRTSGCPRASVTVPASRGRLVPETWHACCRPCPQFDHDLDWKPLPWRLVVLYAVPKPGATQTPKTVPDFESAGGCGRSR